MQREADRRLCLFIDTDIGSDVDDAFALADALAVTVAAHDCASNLRGCRVLGC
jgi:hypothetical protein